ncbi:MAG TPA: glycerol-3-phosphate acyltransferase [Candidatus Micrarchaeia archaeon]|nr:glycerol-3-phosphate acyltransferase [Candidatus Micrarchaeia archaeon]
MIAVGLVALLFAAAYLVGGIPTGWLMGRVMGIDLRRVGTGKIGTSNLFRNAGWMAAAVVGPVQFVQGLLPVLVAQRLTANPVVVAGAGLCAVIGNGWPAYFRYHGGRGVATATGAVSLLWWPGFVFLLTAYLLGWLWHRIPVGVLAGFVGLPAVLWLSHAPLPDAVAAVGVLACICLRRLEGYVDQRKRSLERSEGRPDELWERIIHDRQPGQRLVGPRGS